MSDNQTAAARTKARTNLDSGIKRNKSGKKASSEVAGNLATQALSIPAKQNRGQGSGTAGQVDLPDILPASLPATFFSRPTLEVARDLLGKTLVRRIRSELFTYQVVEVEAYTQDDPACHAFRGPTKRAAILFGPPGYAYVYFIYGMYHCLNVVTELDGVAGAVLIRGLRGSNLDGPGKICRQLKIELAHNGLPLFESCSEIYFAQGLDQSQFEIEATPRIGISKAQDRLWRYIVKGDASVNSKRTI